MDKYRPCPSIIAMFTSDSQHPPRSIHAVYLGGKAIQRIQVVQTRQSLRLILYLIKRYLALAI